jgi:hypothetical protein
MAQTSPQMRLETVEPPHLFDYPARGKVATSDIALLFWGFVGAGYESLQTKLQTNCTLQHGTGHNEGKITGAKMPSRSIRLETGQYAPA